VASITIRRLNHEVKRRLRVQAARNGRSMEEEARVILSEGVRTSGAGRKKESLAEAIHSRMEAAGGGVDLELPPRGGRDREPPDFSDPEFGG